MYGVAGPPPSRSIGPSSGPPSGGDSIGPAMPPVADKDEQEDEDEEDEEDGIGPALPPPPGADGDAFGALASGKSGGDRRLWWQQEQSAPKPTAPIPEDGGVATTVGQTERDDWMVALPTERTSLNTQGQARQFSRNGVQAVGDLSIWTDAPAEREKKAKAVEARSWGAVGMPGGSGGGGGGGGGEPMTWRRRLHSLERTRRAGASARLRDWRQRRRRWWWWWCGRRWAKGKVARGDPCGASREREEGKEG